MAEFKLGRIRFVWKGAWTATKTYYIDDVVRYGGKTYICVVGHTSSADFNTDLEYSPTKWNQMSDGLDWIGDWTTSTFYKINDVVKYGGLLYICNDSHTSNSSSESGTSGVENLTGLEADQSKWTLFAEGFEWKTDWTPLTRYKVNDVVKYGGITYVCNTGHTSSATTTTGLEEHQSLWDEFNQGIEYKGDWTTATRYKANDVVKYGAVSWICVTQHTSTVFSTDQANWAQFVEGFEYESTWSDVTTYQPGDIVSYGGNQYVAKTISTGSNPRTGTSDWDLFTEGFKYQSDWNIATSYKIGDVIRNHGYTYVAATDSPSFTFTVTSSNTATKKFTTTSTVGMVAGMAIRFSGTIVGDLFPGATYYIASVDDLVTFKITDTVGGAPITPNNATGSMTATVAAHPANTSYWTRLNSGFRWTGEWLDDHEYELGDIVRYGVNNYICVKTHRSEGDDGSTIKSQGGGAANSRPDLDSTGTYWNALTIGSEESVLTTRGDMVYYSGNGPTRLPIGEEGQLLRVSSNEIPEWVSLGSVEHVYYVAPHGADTPAPVNGITLDKPWKTVRYAAQQIEKGTRNPKAKRLLELNRVFIQREVSEWIQYQIANNIAPFTSSFDYDEHKCERDVGFIIDRLVWDISHGGNLKTLAAALTYINALDGADLFATAADENGTGTYTKLSAEGTKDVAAYNYMLTVVEAILNQQTPEVNYQALNGDNSTTIVDQAFDPSIITVEPGSLTEITDLVSIVTTALTDKNTTNLPARRVPSNIINVKSGYYFETLPIIVPAETAVQGDEVRAVHVSPADSLIDISDSFYTVKSLDRLEEVISNIVAGDTVTESIGNAQTQNQAWPFADAGTKSAVAQKIRAIKYNTEYRLGTTHLFSYTDPVNYNVGYLVGYGNARALLIQNKKFIQEEVIAYIEKTYPNTRYGRTKARRDAGYIVDALVYDLTYGGNALSVKAGLAYYDGDDNTQPQIPTAIKGLTIDSLNYMKTVAQAIVLDNPYTPLQTLVTRTTGTAGSAAASTAIDNNITDVVSIINAGPAAVGTTVTLVDPTPTNGVNTTTALITAYNKLSAAMATIKTNVATYLSTNYADVDYSEAKAQRDTEIVLKAVGFDFMFDSNYQTIKAAMAYLRGTASELFAQDDRIKLATRNALKYATTQAVANVGGDTTAIARINTLMQIVDDIIYSGSNEGDICQSNERVVDYAVLQLERNRDFIVEEMRAWMNYNFVNFDNYYNSATCARDIGLIVDAVISDIATGSNFASSVAGESYYRIQAALVPSAQMMQTVAAVNEAKRLAQSYVTDSSVYSAVTAAFDNVVAILEGGLTAVPAYTWPDNGTSTATTVSDAAALQTNRATMIAGISSWMNTNYNSIWVGLGATGQAKCQRDVGYIIDAITYDLQYGGTYQSVVAGGAYYSFGTLEIAPGEKAASVASLTELATLMKAYTSAGGDTTVDTLTTLIAGIIDTGTVPSYTLPSVTSESAAVQATHAAILAAKETITTSVTTYITDTFSSYTYNEASCLRDVGEMIDALKWDLKYSSNYKSLLCARYYANAVIGNKEEDMFLCRNGTGIRNMTLEGLSGDLTPANQYGTSRTTAGSYCSLDPGWGPDDFRTWITSRSPYLQNCCTFGNAAIGQKIDGSLHNGGYKSMVSNDFTQLISDGIGAWVTNNGRAELVSVFTYYSHVGYLSEAGGRIRGTNGNNSYGDFGSVAEGYDVTETPNTAIVDNKFQFKASVGHVFTDSINEVLRYEFDNAGVEYSKLNWILTGAGVNASVEADEFRDGGVYQVRLLDNVDDSTLAPEAAGNFGGFGYISNSNTAQGGDATSITIAATDNELSSAYIGMKIYLDGGTGAGQYGIIDTYNAGTKLATVVKESTGAAGWDHVVPGYAIVNPDASTTYTIEPRLTFTAPSYAGADVTLGTTGSWAALTYAEHHAFYTNLTGTTSGSGTGATFNVLRRGNKYVTVEIVNGGKNYTRLDTVTISGTDLGGVSPANDLTLTVTSLNVNTKGITRIDIDGTGYGGHFVAVASGSSTVNTSTDGTTWTENATALPSNVTAVASGKFVKVVDAGDFEVGRPYTITDLGASTAWTLIGAKSPANGYTFVATDPGGGNGKAELVGTAIVGILSGSDATTYSLDGGLTWQVGGLLPASTTWTKIAYGNGRWVATNSTGANTAYSTDGGVTWTAGGNLPMSGADIHIAYGKGIWVAFKEGTTAAASSINGGVTWTSRTLPAGDWKGIAYGNNRFVAIDGTPANDQVAYSLNGTTWTAVTGIPFGATDVQTGVAYGQGVFAVVSAISGAGTNKIMTSEDAINWTQQNGSATIDPLNVAFGNPGQAGVFVSLPNSSSNTGFRFVQGARTKARAYVSQNKIYSIKISEPGSGYAVAPTMTITDPNDVYEAPTVVRIGNGVLANPSFINRGIGYANAAADVDAGDGYADFYQDGQYIAVRRLTQRPVAGSNVVFGHLPNETFKLVNVLSLTGDADGSYAAFFQISPTMKVFNSPEHGTSVSTRIRYSQVRLTGHDFLNIGYGNFTTSNYPNDPLAGYVLTQPNETVEENGGRVFFTSTDQDGNFRVGDLFTVEQSTGVATLNADAFNIAGLQELSLGQVTLGGGSATVTEFSTDPFFTANSDSIVPTQRAIKAYIAAQIGGGGASLNVNSVTAGSIYIAGNTITTVAGTVIQMKAKFEFRSGVTGLPVAWNYFLT